MKLILAVLAFVISNSVFAASFDGGCKIIGGVVTESSNLVCRNSGEKMNMAIHKDQGGDVFGQLFVYGKASDSEIAESIKRLGAAFSVKFPSDFFEAVSKRKPGERVGFESNGYVVYWRSAFEKGNIDYSGLGIYSSRMKGEKLGLRCKAAGCVDSKSTKWYGPVER